jgi:hypothetical protein
MNDEKIIFIGTRIGFIVVSYIGANFLFRKHYGSLVKIKQHNELVMSVDLEKYFHFFNKIEMTETKPIQNIKKHIRNSVYFFHFRSQKIFLVKYTFVLIDIDLFCLFL